MPYFARRVAMLLMILLLAGLAAVAIRAQLEGSERGIAPVDSSGSYEVSGITVDVAARDPEQARRAGWRLAMRKGWKMLYARTNGDSPDEAPTLGDAVLDGIVTGIEVEQEMIGPTRYIARLRVLFDRARAGQRLGVQGPSLRSAPMLLIPVQISGGAPTSLEIRNPWQAAWARFRTASTPIDYVRPIGTEIDPLLLNLAQANRPERARWRGLLDQYGAADILVAVARIERAWPGGPVMARFEARHGPDNRLVSRFALRIRNGEAIDKLLDAGVRRIDAIYADALRSGRLRSDPALIVEAPTLAEEDEVTLDDVLADVLAGEASALTVQIDTPDATALAAAEAAMRAIPGVQGLATTSLALGGVSVVRVSYVGDLEGLRAALAGRGWRVEAGADALRIRRGGQ